MKKWFLLLLLASSAHAQNPGQTFKSLPEGATLISEKEFYLLQSKSPPLPPVDAGFEASNQKVVKAFMAQHPELTDFHELVKLAPQPGDPEVQFLADGNYLFTTTDNAKNPMPVVTLGEAFKYSSLAGSIQHFPQKNNQVLMYQMLYPVVPARDRKQYSYPDPAKVAGLDTEQISRWNERIASSYRDLLLKNTPQRPLGWTDDPTREVGYLDGSDRARSDSWCSAHKAGGVYNNFSWPLKDFTTSVKNQGMRGSCVAFGIISATETQHAFRQLEWVNLSEQAFYNRITSVWQPREYGDNADVRYDFDQAVNERYFFALEKEWPYNPSYLRQEIRDGDTLLGYRGSCTGYTDPYCSETAHQSQQFCANIGTGFICLTNPKPVAPTSILPAAQAELWDHRNRERSVAYIILALKLGNSVVASMGVMPGFDGADANGFGYTRPLNVKWKSRGGHAVHFTGVISNAELAAILPGAPMGAGGGYFITKNSWGACWKDGGYIYIPFDYMKSYGYSAVRVQVP
ncbi:C1 family peptidase [Deinococcus roseus]|uniref:Peptidase C1A papain C-terminal domain-containing protein n=1 Tax=Deinococcus roseus TaxID=392414 RepID=A0ABQ2CYH6_9DEIO|nr:C1 family peptidase [Deinococcus roseus]GGJ32989.1 hypothetical protein GCM10008938_19050 [Deinococcus roseus]